MKRVVNTSTQESNLDYEKVRGYVLDSYELALELIQTIDKEERPILYNCYLHVCEHLEAARNWLNARDYYSHKDTGKWE